MTNILILGAGAMGTTFCFPLAAAGHTVRLVGTHLDAEWIENLRKTGIHPKLKVKLSSRVSAFSHTQLEEAVSLGNELLVLGVNSAGVPWAVEQLGPLLKETAPILLLTKGLQAHGDAIQILPDAVRSGLAKYGIDKVPVGAIAGPCIAAELAAGRDTTVVAAYADARLSEWIARLLTISYYQVRPSTDLVGIEVCAALKNFYALAVGCPAGWLAKQEATANRAQVHNPAAALFAQALLEMGELVSFLGGDQNSVMGLAGAGDLYVTCQAGRNSRTGYFLGSGMRYSEVRATHMANETVEGAELALVIGPALERLFSQGRLDPKAFPLATAITDAICRDLPMRIPWPALHRI
jgi:glycerol-3-phosphate dehydrogenase (NAD(P)+)